MTHLVAITMNSLIHRHIVCQLALVSLELRGAAERNQHSAPQYVTGEAIQQQELTVLFAR